MALITCEDCGAEVSESATACPQCGRPANRNSPERFMAIAIVVVIGLVVFWLALGWMNGRIS